MNSNPPNVLVFGGTSAIAHAMNGIYAQRGARLVLVVRNEEHGLACARDLAVRGAGSVDVLVADLRYKETHADLLARAIGIVGTIDIVVVAHGVLPDQEKLDVDVDATVDSFMVNATSAIAICQRAALVLASQKHGTLIVLSSVAGERGRRSNYAYGAAKAALTAFTSGLRARWAEEGVHVMTVKPGSVDTPMTAGRTVPFKADVKVVAKAIVQAADARKTVLMLPFIWRPIILVMRLLPERIFMRLRF